MDKSRFDNIIKEKLESHVDPIGPSGSEVAKLFEELPNVTSVATSTITKFFIAASSVLFITSVFFIYRTYILEDTMSSMQHELIRLGNGQSEMNIMADTVFWDSLEVITNRAISKNKPSQTGSVTTPALRPAASNEYQQLRLSPEDSQRFVNEVTAQLIATLASNPDLLKDLFSQLPQEALTVESKEEGPNETDDLSPDELKMEIVRTFEEKGLMDQMLETIASDSTRSEELVNIITKNDPQTSSEDQLGLFQSAPGSNDSNLIKDLSQERKKEVLEEYLSQNPKAVAEVAQTMELDDQSLDQILEFAATKKLERKTIALDSLKLDRPVILTAEEVREEQQKIRDRAFFVGAGAGAGSINLEELGNSNVSSIKLAAEYRPQPRFGFSTGLEFYRTEGEIEGIGEIDLSEFSGLPPDIGISGKEIKISLQWLDVPLDAKMYLIPGGKLNPYLGVSIRARALVKEEYTFETTSDEYFTPGFTPGNKFIFPSYGYTIGTQYELNPRLNGALQFQHLLGGEELGLFENHLNPIQVQGMLFFEF